MQIEQILDELKSKGVASAGGFAKNSEALGQSAMTTVEITDRAARDLLAGRLDVEGAERVARNGFEQMRTIARGEAGLIEALAGEWVDWLEGAFGVVFKLIGIKL